jgi:hypothetical protein
VNERLERILNARIVSLERVDGRGYTQAGRHRAVLDDGRSVFVKSAVDALTARWLRLEHVVYASVDAPFLPRFHGYDEREGFPLLVLEDLSHAHWPPPWRDGDVDAMRASLAAVAETSAPPGLTPIGDWKSEWLACWRTVEEDPAPFLSTGLASREWLDAHGAALEAAAARAPLEDGTSLLHLDVRSDNAALDGRGAVLVDWNWASAGNALMDVVAWAPSLCRETGMRPEEVVDADGVGELAALLAGVWASVAGLPPPPTAAPGLRDAQRGALEICLPWACRLLGIPEPE